MGKNKYYSKIDNTIYNLKAVQDLLSQNKQWDAILKIKEITGYDDFKVNNIFMAIYNNNMDIPVTIDSSKQQPQQQNIPKCPTCGSANIRRISGSKKAASIIVFGILSSNLGKTYECLNCKHKW